LIALRAAARLARFALSPGLQIPVDLVLGAWALSVAVLAVG
jgi:hypothetical protein